MLQSIRQAHLASDETYGMPRIRAELSDAGIVASRKRIARLMRDNHLHGVSRRRGWCVTTERNPRQRPAPDLVQRKFVASDINQLWVADMTYVPTWEGWRGARYALAWRRASASKSGRGNGRLKK